MERYGTYGELILYRGDMLVRLPDELPLEVASPAGCATATVAAAFEAAAPQIAGDPGGGGAAVCIFGAGMLGLTAAAYARSIGSSNVATLSFKR